MAAGPGELPSDAKRVISTVTAESGVAGADGRRISELAVSELVDALHASSVVRPSEAAHPSFETVAICDDAFGNGNGGVGQALCGSTGCGTSGGSTRDTKTAPALAPPGRRIPFPPAPPKI